ncbi:MAG: dienelactone hydrolase family protein [Gemmatimonadaceae bacterium]
MPHNTVHIRTADGLCPTHTFTPSTAHNELPAVLLFMDGLGIRPAMFEIGQRLANGGYYVVLPDLYYRSGFTKGANLFGDEAIRAEWTKTVLPTVSIGNIMRDVPSLLAHLEAQPNVRSEQIGTTGYCLGGRMSFAAAGLFPDRIAAAASYHASNLATEAPDSPHRLAPQMKAQVYVAGAIEDAGFDDAQKQRLEDALTAAHVDHVVETYNARHGFVPTDTPVHDPVAAEKHWRTLFGLLETTLKS